MKNKMIMIIVTLVSISCNIWAGEGWVTNATILNVAHVNRSTLGHNAGNIEVGISFNNITWPSTVNGTGSKGPDRYYLPVPSTVDGFELMYSMLMLAMKNGKTVDLYLSDDTALDGFVGNRATILAVNMNN
jgi:hypothetical protein